MNMHAHVIFAITKAVEIWLQKIHIHVVHVVGHQGVAIYVHVQP